MSQLLDKCVILDITFRKPGLTRRAKPNEARVECQDEEEAPPDQTFVRVSKDILHSETYIEINGVDRLLKERLAALAEPNTALRPGMYLVPVDNLEEACADVEATKAKRAGLVERFIEEYPSRVDAAKAGLGGLFNPRNYPSVEAMYGAFGLDCRVLEWGAPSKGKVNEVLYEKLKAEFEANVRNAEAEVTAALREGLLEMVTSLAQQLEPKPDGKKRAITDARVQKVQAFLERLSSRNVMDDEELAALANQARSVLNGKSPDAVRDNRDAIREQLSGVVEGLKALVVDRPGRKFRAD